MFVAVYQKALKLLYVDELLERVRRDFSPRYRPALYEYQVRGRLILSQWFGQLYEYRVRG